MYIVNGFGNVEVQSLVLTEAGLSRMSSIHFLCGFLVIFVLVVYIEKQENETANDS